MSFIVTAAPPLLSNWVATTNPTTGDDAADGYSPGSSWLNTTTGVLWRCINATVNAAVWVMMQVNDQPGYVASRYYGTFEGATSAANSVGTLDTVLYVLPYYLRARVTITSLNIRVVTGGTAGSAVKFGVWRNDQAQAKPTGTAITGLVSNTGIATTGSAALATLGSLNVTLNPGIYWWATAHTTAAPTCLSTAAGAGVVSLAGRSAWSNTTLGGFTVPYTYGNDITTLDLTAAALTDALANAGQPIVHFGT